MNNATRMRRLVGLLSTVQRYGFWGAATMAIALVRFRWYEPLRTIQGKDRDLFPSIFLIPSAVLIALGFLIITMAAVAKRKQVDSNWPVFSADQEVSGMLVAARTILAAMSLLVGWIGGVSLGLFVIR